MDSRAFAQNLAASITGVLLTIVIATSLNYATQSVRRDMIEAYGAQLAVDVSTELTPVIEQANAAALATTELSRDAAAAIVATTGERIRVLGVAEWRVTPQGPQLASAFETAEQNSAFGGVIETYLAELEQAAVASRLIDAVSEAAGEAETVEALARRVSVARQGESTALGPRPGAYAILDPAPAETATFWLVWDAHDDTRRVAARLMLDVSAALPFDAEMPAPEIRFEAYGAHVSETIVPQTLSPLPGELTSHHVVAHENVRLGLLASQPSGGVADLSLAHWGPAIGVGLLIALAHFLLMRAERRRSEATNEQHEYVLRSMALKQRELEASEARFKQLAESTNVVPWTANLDNQRFVYVGPQVEKFTGYPATTWYANGFWTHHIHPEDRRRVLNEEIATLQHNAYKTIEYRIRASNGRLLHIRNMLTITAKKSKNKPTATFAQGFMLDITDMKRAEATLEEARRKAEDANRIKSEFLANMSHELRTPLNAVIGFSEIMKDEVFGPLDPQYREYSESIHQSGRHLLDLINDVLDLSKIEAGRIELSEAETDLGDMLKASVKLLQERVQSAGLHHQLEIDDRLPNVLADERRLKQVVLNLISNAIKFTPPGGSLTVLSRRAAGGGIEIVVRDTGVGMGPDEIPKALSKFGQIDGELARKHDGTGLGLPIARSLMELHGGELAIESEKGKGTEVRLWLPEDRIVSSAA